ncbi:Trihelix transcription factor GT-2, partial [Mucuna pruriens]
MDLFAADHFPVPDNVAPFPDSGDLLFAVDLLSHRHNPQKLRPIRSVPSAHPPPPPHAQDPFASGSGHAPGRESGSSLDAEDEDEDEDNSSASSEGLVSRKRRRRTERKLEDFVKNLVAKVMEKQEQMHRQLVEMIEKKERERIKREEAWKNEEMERIRKDEEVRAEEKSRNLALISFIQNLLGHEIQIPQQTAEAWGKREEGEAEVNGRSSSSDPSNNRWPDVEVQALISLRSSLEHKFRLMGSKGSIWEELAEAMQGMGYNRSGKKCKEKWENINKYYKRTIGTGKKRRLNTKTCPYFDELDIMYRNGLLSIGNALSNTSDAPQIEEEKEQSENLNTST